MKYFFHPEAEAELQEAIEYYEARDDGLGHDFAVEVHSAIERIVAYPKAWSFFEEETRRCQVRRFPYGVVYSEEPDGILIVAVMHLRRDPGYWKPRLR